jgi:hypothetical protein
MRTGWCGRVCFLTLGTAGLAAGFAVGSSAVAVVEVVVIEVVGGFLVPGEAGDLAEGALGEAGDRWGLIPAFGTLATGFAGAAAFFATVAGDFGFASTGFFPFSVVVGFSVVSFGFGSPSAGGLAAGFFAVDGAGFSLLVTLGSVGLAGAGLGAAGLAVGLAAAGLALATGFLPGAAGGFSTFSADFSGSSWGSCLPAPSLFSICTWGTSASAIVVTKQDCFFF